ncbi:sigma-54-dependent Fis family transcriptional regulator [Bordetella genomosp. 1]|uniref:Sigma-54-dependent Fis family transcriptional regulator n=1 Tax=Bordetella genomosp. 1 TaxID=1395607 RepID=A0A261SEM0_9BORD|nr:sigma-54 dependent transcriptional regulator [Bordetella genomosp. 1]MDQ8032877.1 sigma-54 dependent transcriptional regulator [Bordetella sp.]OZI35250.1 sigma-54-dependent Fis family transcriptional regulator [Bordetella genomosp. 1]OZI63793.1 sigma-54-dependent Fis family transcriptional regulator [Bordetella genomosp. 1]
MPHLLVVDDDDAIRETLAEIGRESGFTVAQAGSVRDAVLQWERKLPDLVLADVRLPEGNGMDIFRRVPIGNAEVVVITGHGSMDSAVEALRLGATDYLVKPISMERLQQIMDRVAGTADSTPADQPFSEEGRFGQMLGRSEVMKRVYEQLARVAPTDVSTLLIGESGTGKELAAHAIHDLSARRQRPFVAVNCGAISPNLIESELFGHEKGSFTGADRQHKGYFERADGGTLFLDEVTEMPLDLQVKLLRVLETGHFMRVGTNREIACDVRIVAATNRSPEQAVAQGRLREDLYYRLGVFPLELPALRDRGDDVLFISERFLAAQNKENGTNKRFTDAARTAILQHGWPGNVRELKNFVRRAYILAETDDITDESLLPQTSPKAPRAGGAQNDARVSVQVGATLAEADRRLILATLARCGGVKKQTAAMLGISAKTLYNRLEEYEREGFLIPQDKDAADAREGA